MSIRRPLVSLSGSIAELPAGDSVDSLLTNSIWRTVDLAETVTFTGGVGHQNVDGVMTTNGTRVLIVSHPTATYNGLWELKNDAWVRPADFNTSAKALGCVVRVLGGSTNAGKIFKLDTASLTLESTNLTFSELGGVSGAAAQKGTAVINFGSGGSDMATVTVANTSVLNTSSILTVLDAIGTTDHSSDEQLVESATVKVSAINAGVGFDITMLSTDKFNLHGEYSVSWLLN